jgi:hypothetical protein
VRHPVPLRETVLLVLTPCSSCRDQAVDSAQRDVPLSLFHALGKVRRLLSLRHMTQSTKTRPYERVHATPRRFCTTSGATTGCRRTRWSR